MRPIDLLTLNSWPLTARLRVYAISLAFAISALGATALVPLRWRARRESGADD